MINFLPGSILI